MARRKAKKKIRKTVKKDRGEDALVHARISNPIFVRKTLLEGAIVGAEILKGYERIKKLESQKKRYRAEVKKIIRELKELVRELEFERLPKVPHVRVTEEVPKEKLIAREVMERDLVKGETEKKPKKVTRTHTNVLDDEIKRLQERIDKL